MTAERSAPEGADTESVRSPGGDERPGRAHGAVDVVPEHITTSTRDRDEMARRLQAWLSGVLGGDRRPEVTEVSAPEGNGMSSETLLFTALWDDDGERARHRLVARVEPPPTDYPVFTTYDLAQQYRVMRLVRENTAAPVPETYWYEDDPGVLGGSFFVMAREDGEVPPDVLPYTFGDNWVYDSPPRARRAIEESALSALAEIHSVTPDRHDLAFLQVDRPGSTALERLLNHWNAYHRWVVQDRPSPLLDESFTWLEDHLPDDSGSDTLSWGDSRIGNMMFRDNRVVAVLDWEMASVAPPEVDLGWMCYLHLFFQDLATDLGAPGLPDMFRPVDLSAAYEQRTGRQVGDLTWYLAFAAMRHGAIMRRVTERSIHFGEAEMPDDVDELIMHRATIRAMLEGSYWGRVGL